MLIFNPDAEWSVEGKDCFCCLRKYWLDDYQQMRTEIITHSSAMQKSKRKTNVVLRSMCVFVYYLLVSMCCPGWFFSALKVFWCGFSFFLFNRHKSERNKMQIILAVFLAMQEIDLLTACVADVGLQSLLKPIFKRILNLLSADPCFYPATVSQPSLFSRLITGNGFQCRNIVRFFF